MREIFMKDFGLNRHQMTSTPERLGDLVFSDKMDPYEKLAKAIVLVAAEDYITALRTCNELAVSHLLEFFRSDWYRHLCGIKYEYLIRILADEARRRDMADDIKGIKRKQQAR